jgi:hypothetical protein
MCLPGSRLFWVSSLAYPNLLGTKGYVVVVVVMTCSLDNTKALVIIISKITTLSTISICDVQFLGLSMKIYVKEMSEQGHYYPYMYLLSPV